MIPAIDSINVIFLSVFIEIRIILHCVSRIDLGIVDVKIRVFFSALHQRHHCTCAVGCNTSETVKDVIKYGSLFQAALALAESCYMM